ncbi:MAG: HD domain-containing protein [Rubrivivax sp.]|nr:MAG: HD domain-containing protein [Rubrivivax sp.]
MSSTVQVNEHYLDHVVALSERSEVQASEDIMSGNGLKLVAKGGRIDARVRQRLLEHKLTKPLESLMQVVESVATRRIDRVAAALLERHPLLSSICGEASARLHMSTMNHLILSPQLDSLLSVYASQSEGKLEHAVGVALLSAALIEDLQSQNAKPGTLMLAGLMHDVGELYIDPELLKPGQRLTPQQWKHIASHPIVGAKVLKDMPGAGPQVAQCVLHHHERLDGFGYPQGLTAESLPVMSQALAVAEMLLGVLESGHHHAERAAMAIRLVPGEFNRRLLDRVVTAARGVQAKGATQEPQTFDAADMAQRLGTLATTLARFREARQRIQTEHASYGRDLRALLDHALARGERIRVSLASTGLESCSPEETLSRLQTMDGPARLEVTLVVRELQWRLGELERQVTIRSEQLAGSDAARVRALLSPTPKAEVAA